LSFDGVVLQGPRVVRMLPSPLPLVVRVGIVNRKAATQTTASARTAVRIRLLIVI
jgi:hypothetical protein